MLIRSRLATLACFSVATAASVANAQHAPITPAELAHRVSILANDSTMGRLTGTKGDDAADFLLCPPIGLMPWGPVRAIDGAPVVDGGIVGDSTHHIDSATAAGRFVVLSLPPGSGWRGSFALRTGVPSYLRGAAAIAIVSLDLVPRNSHETLLRPWFRIDDGRRDLSPSPALLFISDAAASRLLSGPQRVTGRIAIIEGPPEVPAQLGVTPEQAAAIHINVGSLHRIRPVRPDSIYNGADDDASGIASIASIAHSLATAPVRPRRSILFLAHTAEEAGLLGGTRFGPRLGWGRTILPRARRLAAPVNGVRRRMPGSASRLLRS